LIRQDLPDFLFRLLCQSYRHDISSLDGLVESLRYGRRP
jgi:hypothetical protein